MTCVSEHVPHRFIPSCSADLGHRAALFSGLTYSSCDDADVNCFDMSTEVQSREKTDAEATAARLPRPGIARLELENMLDVPTTFTISCRLYLYKVTAS